MEGIKEILLNSIRYCGTSTAKVTFREATEIQKEFEVA